MAGIHNFHISSYGPKGVMESGIVALNPVRVEAVVLKYQLIKLNEKDTTCLLAGEEGNHVA